jgi:hypothetical protein
VWTTFPKQRKLAARRITDRRRQREFLQTVLSEIRVDGADLSIVFALNFEAALAALGGTPNDPGCGMARNCISANGARSRSPVTANGKRVAAANALLAVVEQELQPEPGIETDRVRLIAVRLWSAGKPTARRGTRYDYKCSRCEPLMCMITLDLPQQIYGVRM